MPNYMALGPTLDEIRTLKQMLTDAESTMLGWHKKTTTEPTE